MAAKVGLWLTLKTRVKPKYVWIFILVKRKYDTKLPIAVVSDRTAESVFPKLYQITHLH